MCVVCCWCGAWTLVVAPRDRWTLVAPVTRESLPALRATVGTPQRNTLHTTKLNFRIWNHCSLPTQCPRANNVSQFEIQSCPKTEGNLLLWYIFTYSHFFSIYWSPHLLLEEIFGILSQQGRGGCLIPIATFKIKIKHIFGIFKIQKCEEHPRDL